VNIYQDIQNAKEMQMDIAFSSGNLKGHVQQITQDPYGYLLISDIQVSFFIITVSN
jgi:hypothetical protein